MLSETMMAKLKNVPNNLNSKITELNNKLATLESKAKSISQIEEEVINNARVNDSRKS